MRGHRDLTRASVAAVVCALVAALVPLELIRIVAALPLTLFLPGFAIVAVSFGDREMAPPKLWTLSVGVSLMVLAIGAVLLNVFPFGLTTASWAVLLGVVVLAACRGAALRRGRPQERRPTRRGWRLAPRDTALLATAAAIVIVALVVAQKPLPADKAEGFAALWMLPTNSKEDAVRVGVLSSEQDPTSYRLQVDLGKGRSRTLRVSLDPGEEETFEVPVPSAPGGGKTHLVASLYRSDEPRHLYRRVTSWLPKQATFPQSP
jgi:uncharacterized membrane protein